MPGMVGKSKSRRAGGKSKGKGTTIATKSPTSRRRGPTQAPSRGICKSHIRKIARRGGCKRLAASVYDEARKIMRVFVDQLMHDTGAIMEMQKRKTIRSVDVMFALKKQGRTLYAVR